MSTAGGKSIYITTTILIFYDSALESNVLHGYTSQGVGNTKMTSIMESLLSAAWNVISYINIKPSNVLHLTC